MIDEGFMSELYESTGDQFAKIPQGLLGPKVNCNPVDDPECDESDYRYNDGFTHAVFTVSPSGTANIHLFHTDPQHLRQGHAKSALAWFKSTFSRVEASSVDGIFVLEDERSQLAVNFWKAMANQGLVDRVQCVSGAYMFDRDKGISFRASPSQRNIGPPKASCQSGPGL